MIAPLIPSTWLLPQLEVPSDSSSGMMSDGDGDSPCLADGHVMYPRGISFSFVGVCTLWAYINNGSTDMHTYEKRN